MELRCTAERETRLLSILRRELQLSSTLVRRLKYCGAYTVNGEPAHTDRLVRPGDVVRVCLDEPRPDYPAEDGPLSILYEDEALLAVDKPQGMLVHPSFSRQTGTLANRLLGYYDRTGQACAVHPVSRLDRDTFGVVLLAKNAHAHALLIAAEKHKTYHAAVRGVPQPPEGIDRRAHRAPVAGEPAALRARRRSACPLGLPDPADGARHLPARAAAANRPDAPAARALRVAWLPDPRRPAVRRGGVRRAGTAALRRFHPLLPPVFEKMAGNPVETGRFA